MSLTKWFAWTASPVICNGPMLGAATPALATEVSHAGGLGFLASIFDLSEGSAQLRTLDAELAESTPSKIGISFITGDGSAPLFAQTALPIIAKHRPAAVWLFAPAAQDSHGIIIAALNTLNPAPRVFVQIGNVAAAREAVVDGADVLVCQGIDAGGHQFRRGAGIVSLVPEVCEMLRKEFPDRQVAVLAAGGIVDHRGVVAAMALGANGVVMGTRFTVAKESVYPDFRKQLVLKTVDGGSSTLKAPFHDEIKNSALWGPLYDGRAIIGPVHRQFMSGSSLDECKKMLQESYSPEEATRMLSTWAGTGVGLVNKGQQPAGDIVVEVRQGAVEHMKRLAFQTKE
ncbi:hypothetical protein L249_1451 [Ophiocordyceps polyrhachis-furcata BCC 54312]|uniref:Uncharacterized protein n=1 Tax=Ophiocordyceps polyrhachis-furcata BCC 54312 TaxID=1330021 RepID=A0A367L4F3_9HYPO|nr:hypothetical protein L249_1451 [Ophiocordyceps polyrhachis-furcata BCC 54312]